MNKKKTFQTIEQEYETAIKDAYRNLTLARTNYEVEVANLTLHKAISGYTKNIKKHISNIALQAIVDQDKMQKLMQDKFGFNEKDYPLTYEINRNTIRWTVTTKWGKYWYISKCDYQVDMENFYNWVLQILCA